LARHEPAVLPSEALAGQSARQLFLIFDGGAILLVLRARLARASLDAARSHALPSPTQTGGGRPCRSGFSVLEASQLANIPQRQHLWGRGRCTLCRVRLIGDHDLNPPQYRGEAPAATAGSGYCHVRQACQIRPTKDISVVPLVPAADVETFMRRRTRRPSRRNVPGPCLCRHARFSRNLPRPRPPYDAMFIPDDS